MQRVVEKYGFENFPQFVLLWPHLRKVETRNVETMRVSDEGLLLYNPEFANDLPDPHLAGVLFHEMLHVILQHGQRGVVVNPTKPRVWAIAIDIVINEYLLGNDIELPQPRCDLRMFGEAAALPPSYTGPMTAEALYAELSKYLDDDSLDETLGLVAARVTGASGSDSELLAEVGKEADEDAEGGVGRDPGEGTIDAPPPSPDFAEILEQIRLFTPELQRLLEIKSLESTESKVLPFRLVLKEVFARAVRESTGTIPTYSAIRRRDAAPNMIFRLPVYRGYSVTLGIMVDVSGSMNREWLKQIYATIVSLTKHYNTKTWFATHTDKLCFQGWVGKDSAREIEAGLAHTGGTDPSEAYEAIPKGLHILVHFTDQLFGSGPWPERPHRVPLLVARYGYSEGMERSPSFTAAPSNARVIDVIL
jgi:predicted metal-dependent peptidase